MNASGPSDDALQRTVWSAVSNDNPEWLECLAQLVSEMGRSQALALATIVDGKNTFLSGPGGSGKTHLMRAVIALARSVQKSQADEAIACTASTGVAASHLSGGMTVHSFIERVRRGVINAALLKLLILDEISMVTADLFERLSGVLQNKRLDTRPFGGVQLIIVGDFFQLAPIVDQPTGDRGGFYTFL